MVMLRRVLSALVLAVLAAGVLTGVARAGRFWPPVRLPGSEEEPEWHFAVNDRGQAVAVRFGGAEREKARVLVYPIRHSGRLGRPWRLDVPDILPPEPAPTVALDDRGRVAVAIDVEERGSEGEHSFGSGEHVAFASWRLGSRPPALQILTPRGDETSYSEGQLNQPEIVIGPNAITALWTAGGRTPEEGVEPAQVDEAFGTVGGPLHAVRLTAVRAGGGTITHLALAPNGAPLASWVDGQGRLTTVKGNLNGTIGRPRETRTLSHFRYAGEFANDAYGNTALLYWTTPLRRTHSKHWQTQVMLVSSHDGQPFDRPRVLGEVPAGGSTGSIDESLEASILAGGRQSMFALWGYPGSEGFAAEGFRVRGGSLHGPLGPQQRVGPDAMGFVSPAGRAVIVYDHERYPTGGGTEAAGVVAVSGPVGGRFGASRTITPHLEECSIPGQLSIPPEPIATSPDGRAIFNVQCPADEYLIRYAP
jgi:hypothetical protein